MSKARMGAAVLHAPRDLRYEQVPVPDPGPGEVLVRVRACAICPTDLRKFTGASQVAYPFILGHEAAGEVAALGPAVAGIEPGLRVAVMPALFCKSCYYCQAGRYNLCENMGAIGGAAEQGARFPGAYAQYVRVPADAVFPIPASLSFEEAAMADPLACVVHSIERCNVSLGGSVVIVGAGPMGLLHVLLARLRGARVITTEPLAERRRIAGDLGACVVINPDAEDPVERVLAVTDGRGADVVIVAVGNPQAEAQAVRMASRRGIVNFFAGTYPQAEIAIDPNQLHYHESVVTGAFAYDPETFQRALDLMVWGLVDVRRLITDRYRLAKLAEGFRSALAGEGLKKMVLP